MRREHMRIAKVERERFDALAIVKRDDRISHRERRQARAAVARSSV
jgi:hypothetical protein